MASVQSPHAPARRRTIRKAAPLIILLIAGATLNVAVAWGMTKSINAGLMSGAIGTSKFASGDYRDRGSWDDWCRADFFFIRGPGFARVLAIRARGNFESESEIITRDDLGFIPEWAKGFLFAQHPRKFGALWDIVDARGWPMVSLISAARYQESTGGVDRLTHCVGIVLPQGRSRQGVVDGAGFALPLQPLFPGFAINTLFYAGVLWVLWATPFALRRMIRRRRGQCPACAYPIGQNPVCTECGAAVTPTPKAING